MHLAHFSHYQEKSCMLYVQVLPIATKALYKVQTQVCNIESKDTRAR